MACTQAGLFNFQYSAKTIRSSILFSKIKGEPKALLIEKDSIKWIGLSDGQMIKIDKSGKTQNSKSPYRGRYQARGVSDILQDNMGGIWVGGEEGLDYTHFNSFAANP